MNLERGRDRGRASPGPDGKGAHPEVLYVPLAMHSNGVSAGAQAISFRERKRVSGSSENPLTFGLVSRGLCQALVRPYFRCQTTPWYLGLPSHYMCESGLTQHCSQSGFSFPPLLHAGTDTHTPHRSIHPGHLLFLSDFTVCLWVCTCLFFLC